MSSPRSQSSPVWYKNPWFILAAIAVVGLIGTLNGPPDSTASPAPIMSPAPSLDLPAPVPAIDVPAVDPTPTPITNNNVIVLGNQDAQQLLESLPQPVVRPRREKPAPLAPQPSPEVTKPAIPARQSSVDPDCLPQMVAHHERVADFYRRMSQGK